MRFGSFGSRLGSGNFTTSANMANLKAVQRRLAGFFWHCKTSVFSAVVGVRDRFGLVSPARCTASISSTGGGEGGHRKASIFNCTFFPVSRLTAQLAAEGAAMGRGGVGTTDMHTTGAQSCVTTVPERSYVMVR